MTLLLLCALIALITVEAFIRADAREQKRKAIVRRLTCQD